MEQAGRSKWERHDDTEEGTERILRVVNTEVTGVEATLSERSPAGRRGAVGTTHRLDLFLSLKSHLSLSLSSAT